MTSLFSTAGLADPNMAAAVKEKKEGWAWVPKVVLSRFTAFILWVKTGIRICGGVHSARALRKALRVLFSYYSMEEFGPWGRTDCVGT